MIDRELKSESDVDASLHLILFFDHPPRRIPWFLDALAALSADYSLELTAVYNGQPYEMDRQLSRFKLRGFQSFALPLRLEPEQIVNWLLSQPLPAVKARLWLSVESLWHFESLKDWLEKLSDDVRFIMPMPLPVGHKKVQREFQALVPLAAGVTLKEAGLIRFPACLLWSPAWEPEFQAWLNQRVTHHQNPVTLRVQVDTASRIWTMPALPAADLTLDPDNAEQLWQGFLQNTDALAFQALLKRAPGSARLYALAKRFLDPQAALNLLALGFRSGLLSPMMLKAAEDLLITIDPVAAAACRTLLAGRFGDAGSAFAMSYEGWADCLPRRESLSICLIVRDESEMIVDCLKSIKELAAEMIVVDTGSQDKTPLLALEQGAKVFYHVWPENFAMARNWSLDYASQDWIFVLDADQRLESESLTVLCRFLWEPPPGLPRGQVAIKNLSEQGQVSLVHFEARLFPASKSLRYRGRIHEEVLVQSQVFSPSPVFEGLNLLHWGYQRERVISKDKARRNVELLLKQQAEEPNQIHWMTYLGDSLSALGDHEAALAWYRQVLEAWDQQSPERFVKRLTLRRTHSQMSRLLLRLKRFSEVLQLADQYQHVCEAIPDFWYIRGLAYLGVEKKADAQACFETCLTFRDHSDKLLELDSAYSPDCVDSLPLNQLLLLAATRFRLEGESTELLKLLKDWMKSGCPTSPALPHPLFYWAELALLGLDQDLPLLSPELRSSPAGLGVLEALVRLGFELPDWPSQSWIQNWIQSEFQGLSAETDWSQMDNMGLQDICNQLWQSTDIRHLWLAQALLYLKFIQTRQVEHILMLSMLLHTKGQSDLALQWVNAAQERSPTDPHLLNNQAILLFEAGFPELACQRLEICLKIDPFFEDAQNNLIGIQRWMRRS